MTQDEQKEREAFEAWASQEYPYSGDARSGAWVGWKARAAYESARTQQVMGDGSATIAPMSDASAPITPANQQPVDSPEGFAVKHYIGDDHPTIKFDGGYIEVHGDREHAEAFLKAIYRAATIEVLQSGTTITVLKQAREALESDYRMRCRIRDVLAFYDGNNGEKLETIRKVMLDAPHLEGGKGTGTIVTAIDNELKRLGVV